MPNYLIKKKDIKDKFEISDVFRCKYVLLNTLEEVIWFQWEPEPTYTKAVSGVNGYLKVYINKYFEDWQNPTKAEIDMFEMITGEKYLHHHLGIDIC